MSSSPETGTRKASEPQPERVITRQTIKNELSTKDTLQERKLLRDALMAVYRGDCNGHEQAVEYGLSESFIRFRVQQLMPTGLKANDERLDLCRCASDLAEVPYKNTYTDAELR